MYLPQILAVRLASILKIGPIFVAMLLELKDHNTLQIIKVNGLDCNRVECGFRSYKI